MPVREVTVTKAQSTNLKMSYEEFLQWVDEDTHAEWVGGEVIIHMPPKNVHQNTVEFLYELLSLFVRLFTLGKVRIAPFEVRLESVGSSREPDLFFNTQENLNRLTPERLIGPPDLVIEVISDDSVSRDRDDKFKEYRQAGVREYWIVDPRPEKQRADFYRLAADGDYALFATEDNERVHSHVLPAFWLRPAWLWQVDALDPLTAFFEMRGVSPEQAEQILHVLRAGSTKTQDENPL